MAHTPDQKTLVQNSSDKRLSQEGILEQVKLLSKNPELTLSFQHLPYVMLLLNKERQIIYSNDALLKTLGLGTIDDILGLRVGEAFQCIHCNRAEGGCGTSEYCKVCGSFLAITESQQSKSAVSKECRLTFKKADAFAALDLQVHAMPLKTGEEYTVFIIKDVSEEKRKKAFERIFFHDLLNTSGAIKGLITLLESADSLDEIKELCTYASQGMEMLIEEIISQKDLISAENDELALKLSNFSPDSIVKKLSTHYKNDGLTKCKLQAVYGDKTLSIYSDAVLVRRVVGNMLKNAIEASGTKDTVILGCRTRENFVEFFVHNPSYIPKEAQLQLFQRSFSSKGTGRGLGTYSMKLLGEKFLGGKVNYTTDEVMGTEFSFTLPIKGSS